MSRLNLERYLLHDKPFVVIFVDPLQKDRRVLHIKMSKSRSNEFAAKLNSEISISSIYNSVRWIEFDASTACVEIAAKMLQASYRSLKCGLSYLSQVIYSEKNSCEYDIDFIKILESSKPFTRVEFGKKVLDI